jgi:histidinol-phosphate phosphatase family protein
MKVVFLDRDGVINKYPGDYEYIKSLEEFIFLPGAKPALKALTGNKIKLFVVSNQAGVSKGIYSHAELDRITEYMLKELGDAGVEIEQVMYCIHKEEENCKCRKPKAGMVEDALAGLKESGYEVDLMNSYFIGDSIRDIETGKSVGLQTILVFSGREKPQNSANWKTKPDFTCADIQEAVDIILNR